MKAPKSGKQRSEELSRRRKARAVKVAAERKADLAAFKFGVRPPDGIAPVKQEWLAIAASYRAPEFIRNGYYADQDFVCKGCLKREVWTATQQKWWYEIAGGGWNTRATRCRPGRRKERERAADHQRRTQEGKARKSALKAAGKWRTGL